MRIRKRYKEGLPLNNSWNSWIFISTWLLHTNIISPTIYYDFWNLLILNDSVSVYISRWEWTYGSTHHCTRDILAASVPTNRKFLNVIKFERFLMHKHLNNIISQIRPMLKMPVTPTLIPRKSRIDLMFWKIPPHLVNIVNCRQGWLSNLLRCSKVSYKARKHE